MKRNETNSKQVGGTGAGGGNALGLLLIAAVAAWLFFTSSGQQFLHRSTQTLPTSHETRSIAPPDSRSKRKVLPTSAATSSAVTSDSSTLTRSDRRELDNLIEKVGK